MRDAKPNPCDGNRVDPGPVTFWWGSTCNPAPSGLAGILRLDPCVGSRRRVNRGSGGWERARPRWTHIQLPFVVARRSHSRQASPPRHAHDHDHASPLPSSAAPRTTADQQLSGEELRPAPTCLRLSTANRPTDRFPASSHEPTPWSAESSSGQASVG